MRLACDNNMIIRMMSLLYDIRLSDCRVILTERTQYYYIMLSTCDTIMSVFDIKILNYYNNYHNNQPVQITWVETMLLYYGAILTMLWFMHFLRCCGSC